MILAVALAVLAIAVHVTVSILIRAPRAVGLLATAQVGVPAAVIALGLPTHAITEAQAAAIFCAALVSIAATATGAAILRRGAGAKAQTPMASGRRAAHGSAASSWPASDSSTSSAAGRPITCTAAGSPSSP